VTDVSVSVSVAWSVRLCVCLSHSCTLLQPLDGTRCHLARTLVWSQVTNGRFRGWNPQFIAIPLVTKLLWPLLQLGMLNAEIAVVEMSV